VSIRYFGEYLISKNAISAQDLARALITQTKEIPPLADIALEMEFLNAEEVVQAFHLQQERGLSFLWAVKMLKGEQSEIVRNLETVIEERRTPLGQILLNLKAIDLKSLTLMLDDYLSQAEAPREQAPPTQETTQEAAPAELDEVTALLSEGEDLTYPEGMLAELETLFEERKYRAVKVALSFLKDKNIPEAKVITKLLGDISKILQPVSKFTSAIGIRHMKTLLVHMQSKIDSLQDPSIFSEDEIRSVASNLSLCNEELWKLRNLVCSEFTEEHYAQIKGNRDHFQKALKGQS
jgi:hypothetical protein